MDQLIDSSLLDLPCLRILEVQCMKMKKATISLSPVARMHIVKYTIEIIKNLCNPTIPNRIADIIERIDYCFPSKIRPSCHFLSEIQSNVEKGKRKTLYISSDKVFSSFKSAFSHVEPAVSLFLAHLMEHIIGQILQWTVHYESKIHSGYIEGTDIEHIFSLFGTPKQSKSPVYYSLPFVFRKSTDYKSHAKEIQYLLRSSVQHLGIVVRIFSDSLSEELSQIRTATESFLCKYENELHTHSAAQYLLESVKSAQLVFDRASELYSHVTLLSECVDDTQEDQTRLLGSCLIESAEDETFYTFAHYSSALFSSDCREWINSLAQIPHIMRTLANEFQKILHITLANASSRRYAEIQSRFSDPHSCQLCATGFNCDTRNLTSPGQSSGFYCVSPQHCDSPQLYWLNGVSDHTVCSFANGSIITTCSSDNITNLSVPFCSVSMNQELTNSPYFTSFSNRRQPKPNINHSLDSSTKDNSSRRSVSSSPSRLLSSQKSMSVSLNTNTSDCQITELLFRTRDDDYSSSSSSSPSCLSSMNMESFELTTVSPSCSHMVIAFRYLLPQLLLLPNFQLLLLVDHIQALLSLATEESEHVMLKDVMSILSKTRSSVSNSLFNQDWVKLISSRLAFFMKTPVSTDLYPTEGKNKLEELISSVRRTQHPSELPIVLSEFLMDGHVQIRTDHNRSKKCERIAYLFNNWLILCKKQKKVFSNVVSTPSSNTNYVLKVKKRICLEQFHLIDLASELGDNNDVLFLFDLEFWETPKLSSTISSSLQHNTDNRILYSNSTTSQIGLQSISSSQINKNQFHFGSVSSVSTLTSTNTLVDNSLNYSQMNSINEGDKLLILPTAGDIAVASNNTLIGNISSYPKQRFTFIFSNKQDKANWLSSLVYLHLSRLFKRYLTSIPRQDLPLILPSPSVYRYSTPDSPFNILLEPPQTDGSAGIPIIRAATMLKLIERMTYHEYFDSKTLNTFLLTYRRYTTALELLDLLIERFNVPDPDFTQAVEKTFNSIGEHDSLITCALRLEQRFRSLYKRRVQYRVLNFIIKWVKNSSYYKLDILPNAVLRSKLWSFLDTVDARNLSDNVMNIRKSLLGDRIRFIPTIGHPPPEPLDLGIVGSPDDVKLTTVHPLEFARQVTLYEWELYSRIEFWEVTGKEKMRSPNFEASLQFSNKFKWWLVSSIMSADHLEDRVVIMQRVADLLIYFENLNNLQGVQEAKAALMSSPVYRLNETFEALITKSKHHYRNLFECLRQSVEEDNGSVYFADYQEKLHRIHPPGLPFIAVGDKTQLIHLELKHSDWVDSSGLPLSNVSSVHNTNNRDSLINFWKCRQMAELVEYYLSFQQTPYNFSVNKPIRQFLETLDPLKFWSVESEDAFDDIMYEKSLKIQPKLANSLSTVSREQRSLTYVELKIAAALNLVQPDHKLTTDSREFRNLIQMISTATNCSSSLMSTNDHQLSKIPTDRSDRNSMQSNDKLNTPVSTTVNESVSLDGDGKSSSFSDIDKTVNSLKKSSVVDHVAETTVHTTLSTDSDRSVITSIKLSNVTTPTKIDDDDDIYTVNSSPPPLPPRIGQSFRETSSSQMLLHNSCSLKLAHNKDILECENLPANNNENPPVRPLRRSLMSISPPICCSVTEENCFWLNSIINEVSNCTEKCKSEAVDNGMSNSPPPLPPRIRFYGSHCLSGRTGENMKAENNDIYIDSPCTNSWSGNLLSSNNVPNTNRSSPPPLPPKKSTTLKN